MFHNGESPDKNDGAVAAPWPLSAEGTEHKTIMMGATYLKARCTALSLAVSSEPHHTLRPDATDARKLSSQLTLSSQSSPSGQ